MMSPENTNFSPWPAVSSLSMSAWPIPKNETNLKNSQKSFTNPKWKEKFAPNFTSSSEVSPSLLGELEGSPSFQFEGDCSKDLKIDNLDQLAAKLLTLSDHSQGPEEEEEDGSSESEININLPHSSSSNTRSSPDVISSGKSEADADDETGPNVRFKTEICRNFKEKGHCLYGDLCQFAHGKDEMRNVGQHSKYKTKRCQKFWIAGYCAYGPRCNFLHYEEKDSAGPLHIKPPVKGHRSGSQESGYNTPGPSLSPPAVRASLPPTPLCLDVLYRPSLGSGRLAAYTRNGEYHWIDTRTQRYV